MNSPEFVKFFLCHFDHEGQVAEEKNQTRHVLAVFPHRHQHYADWIWRLYALIVGLPCVGSIMRHELQVLDTDRLVLQLGH